MFSDHNEIQDIITDVSQSVLCNHNEIVCIKTAKSVSWNRSSCNNNKGKPCKTFLTEDEILQFRTDYACLDSDQLSMVLLGKISPGTHKSETTMRSKETFKIIESRQTLNFSPWTRIQSAEIAFQT